MNEIIQSLTDKNWKFKYDYFHMHYNFWKSAKGMGVGDDWKVVFLLLKYVGALL